MRIDLDLFRLTTIGPFHSARSYLQEMHEALPHAEARARATLREQALREGWDEDEYHLNSVETDATYADLLPGVLCRSFVIYLHSLVEHQLLRVAEHVREERQLRLAVRDIAGAAVERLYTYLTKVAEVEVQGAASWGNLRDLAKVRDVLVHRGGKLGPEERERSRLREISRRSGDRLAASYGWDDPDSELEFGRDFCDYYMDRCFEFIEMLLVAIGHPEPRRNWPVQEAAGGQSPPPRRPV